MAKIGPLAWPVYIYIRVLHDSSPCSLPAEAGPKPCPCHTPTGLCEAGPHCLSCSLAAAQGCLRYLDVAGLGAEGGGGTGGGASLGHPPGVDQVWQAAAENIGRLAQAQVQPQQQREVEGQHEHEHGGEGLGGWMGLVMSMWWAGGWLGGQAGV